MSEWISVKDSMPPMPPHTQDAATEVVYVYTDWTYANRYGIGFYDYEDGGHWFVQGCLGSVTHWRPLPAPPEK